MNGFSFGRAKYFIGAGLAGSLLLAQGCIATRDWVRENVQDPLSGRISQTEGRLEQAEGQIGGLGNRMSGVEGKLGQFEGRMGQFEGRLGQVDAKADRALNAIANLRLERKLVIDMKDGANFAINSTVLPPQAQKEIDSFLSDLKGDALGADGVVFMVAGHTDNVGNDDYNYDLGKRRADAVSRYLITKKNLDPLRVVPVSYGQSAPVEDNKTAPGRAKNRRVEILVYRDGVTSTAATPAAQPAAPRSSQQSVTPDGRISQR
ncbi:MAG: OmpA family protein [Deltaproteobacteria bacterium]|nr:OmpA family protein [Deltaproteobacteria bacterium]